MLSRVYRELSEQIAIIDQRISTAQYTAAKDHDLKQAVKEHESQLLQVTQSLAEYKSRALNAELKLEESSSSSSRVQALEKEVKEKNILMGKLRQEGTSLYAFVLA